MFGFRATPPLTKYSGNNIYGDKQMAQAGRKSSYNM